MKKFSIYLRLGILYPAYYTVTGTYTIFGKRTQSNAKVFLGCMILALTSACSSTNDKRIESKMDSIERTETRTCYQESAKCDSNKKQCDSIETKPANGRCYGAPMNKSK